jgi:hypothetical protein
MSIKRLFFLLIFITNCLETYAGLRSRWVCEECRISADGLSNAKRQQIFSTETLNLKGNTISTPNALRSANSSIVINETDFNTISAVGNSWIDFSTTNKTFSMNIGSANNSSPQTWTLPANFMTNFSGFVRVDFVLPSTLPTPLQIAGADRVMKGYSLDDEGNPLTEYDHFDISNTFVNHLGTSYDSGSGVDVAYNEPDYEYADVPLEMGDNWTSIEEEKDYKTGLSLTKTEQINTIDAYGSITTPDGTFDCLRMSSTIKNYTRPDESSTFTLQSTTYGVSFITKEGYYFYAQKPSSITSGTITLSNFGYRKIVNTATLSETSEVRLNNDSKGVSINSDNTLAHPSAILDIQNDSLGVLIPRIAKANRPHSPATGLLVYQIDNTPGFYYYDGSAWRILGSSPSARIASEESLKGLGRLSNGSSFIKFETPQENPENVVIQIQPEGDCNGLYISKKTKEGFEVKELQKGKSNMKFSWKIN